MSDDFRGVAEYCRPGLRSAGTSALDVSRTRTAQYDRSFAVAGPHIWNSWHLWSDSLSAGTFATLLKLTCLTAAAPVFLNWRLRNVQYDMMIWYDMIWWCCVGSGSNSGSIWPARDLGEPRSPNTVNTLFIHHFCYILAQADLLLTHA